MLLLKKDRYLHALDFSGTTQDARLVVTSGFLHVKNTSDLSLFPVGE